MRLVARSCGVAALIVSLCAAADRADAASTVPWSGERAFGEGVSAPAFNGFSDGPRLAWEISYDAETRLYTYQYDFFDGEALFAPHHFIFQASADFEPENTAFTFVGHGDDAWSLGLWQNDLTSPTMPADIFGIRLDAEATSHTIITDLAPGWGDFYWRRAAPRDPDGAADAWNAGIGTWPDQDAASYEPWIATPMLKTEHPTSAAAPTPTAAAMGLALLGGLLMRRTRQR